jgi:hypothetical protein
MPRTFTPHIKKKIGIDSCFAIFAEDTNTHVCIFVEKCHAIENYVLIILAKKIKIKA